MKRLKVNLTKINRHKTIVCENCTSNKFSKIFSGTDKLLGIPGKFDVCECEQCGLFQVLPKLCIQDMEKYYPEDYICYLEAIEDEKNPIIRFNRYLAQRKRCRQVKQRTVSEGSILDIGCATGIFLNEMRKIGWKCQGVEPDLTAVKYAKERFGLDVFHGFLEDAKLPSNTYDVVTLWDVLEHVYDLNSTVSEIIRVLKPGGVIIATLPNATAFERHIFGEYWVGWEVPRHYRTFTPNTIYEFLVSKNFKDINIFSFTGRHGAFMLSIEFWLHEKKFPSWKEKLIRALSGSILTRMLLLPVFIVFEILNHSTVMSFSARKPSINQNNP